MTKHRQRFTNPNLRNQLRHYSLKPESFNCTATEKHIEGHKFERMTLRNMTRNDGDLNVKSPNVYIGYAALRGLSLDAERFSNINKDP